MQNDKPHIGTEHSVRPCIFAPAPDVASSRFAEIMSFNNKLTELAMICPKVNLAAARAIANSDRGNDDIRRVISGEIGIMVRNLRILQAKLETIWGKPQKKKKKR